MAIKPDPHLEYYQYLCTRSSRAAKYRSKYLYPKILSHLPGKVLDVGCGIGDFLAMRDGILGADINEHCVRHCTDLGLSARVIESDIPFESSFFDAAILDNVLEHIEDPRPILLEVSRVLKHRGLLMIGVPGKRGYASDPDHKVYYELSDLQKLMDPFGFSLAGSFFSPLPSKRFYHLISSGCLYALFKKS